MISYGLVLYSGSITGMWSKVISLVKSPGLPWNIDVLLLAMVYVAIGYYCKETIEEWFKSDCYRYDLFAIFVAAFIVLFCYSIYREGRPLYYFDMKSVYYHEFFAALVIPCAFGLILARLIHMLKRNAVSDRLINTLAFFGQRTIPVMYLHIPLNTWQGALGYDQFIYVFIGVCVPIAVSLLLGKMSLVSKILGFPKVE